MSVSKHVTGEKKLMEVILGIHLLQNHHQGTSGAFVTGLVLTPRFGNNMSFIITPVCFAVCSTIWSFISDLGFVRRDQSIVTQERPSYFRALWNGLWVCGVCVWVGARIIFMSRKFVWLVPGYAIALYAHRYLKNGIVPHVARRYLGESAWSQILVGGSNLGELLGAFCVFVFKNIVWLVAAAFLPNSFGWAAGDVSLAAYIQAALARQESDDKNTSALGAVMAFLYSFYITLYAVAGTFLGRYLDSVYTASGGSDGGGTIHSGLIITAGVHFTVLSVVVFCATFAPRGTFSLNPEMVSFFGGKTRQGHGLGGYGEA
ncbi:hypothetical protein C8034_v000345 [Colletotrichum sidae]|uniref:Uncharacterized protein n=1 Tax=Colletotrichum sidae TaxID=1347389 RepID=A0A4V3I344_9PEZI|nr:hypothetical protein C8034_v000345 [Colletotrichum sidae]